jgi:hypothetical protein
MQVEAQGLRTSKDQLVDALKLEVAKNHEAAVQRREAGKSVKLLEVFHFRPFKMVRWF